MPSQVLEILETLGGEKVRYVTRLGSVKTIVAVVDPARRVDTLGNANFLTKTYEVWISKDPAEGIAVVAPNADTLSLKLEPTDPQETVLKVTKIFPDRDHGIPGDGVGMWHLEAVA